MTVGDVGYLDDDGYLYLTDRRHHMIISGGVNIYPQEAEDLLITHPKVLDAAVFGIPDDDMGQSVKGVVQTVDPPTPPTSSPRNCSTGYETGWHTTSVRGRSPSRRSYQGPTPASSTSRSSSSNTRHCGQPSFSGTRSSAKVFAGNMICGS